MTWKVINGLCDQDNIAYQVPLIRSLSAFFEKVEEWKPDVALRYRHNYREMFEELLKRMANCRECEGELEEKVLVLIDVITTCQSDCHL